MKGSFVDLQVNGMLGIDFAETVNGESEYLKVCDALEARGTGAFLATVITSSMESYRKTLPALARFIEGKANRGRMIGLHLEGPFISPEDGAVGTHPKQYVLPQRIELFEELRTLAGGHLKLITVAPEREGGLELIKHAVKCGVKVSVGHCLADYEQTVAAAKAGATLGTHVGNGVPNMLHRHKNPIVSMLASPLTAMFISDGNHLPAEFLKMALAAKGLDASLIVSDVAPVAGLPKGVYDSFGTQVRICDDGAIRNLNAPTLAGSSSSIFECMNFLAKALSLDEATLWKLGRDNPAKAIGLDAAKMDLPELAEFKDGAFKLIKS